MKTQIHKRTTTQSLVLIWPITDAVFVEPPQSNPVIKNTQHNQGSYKEPQIKSKPIPIPTKRVVSLSDIPPKQEPCYLPFYPKEKQLPVPEYRYKNRVCKSEPAYLDFQ